MKRIILSIFALFISVQAIAQEKSKPLLEKKKLSIAAGIARNSAGPFDGTGFQFFAAYSLDHVNLMENVNTSVEFGYMDYGFSGGDSGGLWVTGVVSGPISNGFGWLARFGIDLGDDSGLMFGGGASYDLSNRLSFRGEYVIRDDIDFFQVNFVYKL